MATQSFCGTLRKVLSLLKTSSSNRSNLKLGRLFISCAKGHLAAVSAHHLPEDESGTFLSDHSEIPWGLAQLVKDLFSGNLNLLLLASVGKPFILASLVSVLSWCRLLWNSKKKSRRRLLICSFGIRLFPGCILSFSLEWTPNFTLVRN